MEIWKELGFEVSNICSFDTYQVINLRKPDIGCSWLLKIVVAKVGLPLRKEFNELYQIVGHNKETLLKVPYDTDMKTLEELVTKTMIENRYE